MNNTGLPRPYPPDPQRCECACGCRHQPDKWELFWEPVLIQEDPEETRWRCLRCRGNRHTAYEKAFMLVAGRNTTNA